MSWSLPHLSSPLKGLVLSRSQVTSPSKSLGGSWEDIYPNEDSVRFIHWNPLSKYQGLSRNTEPEQYMPSGLHSSAFWLNKAM